MKLHWIFAGLLIPVSVLAINYDTKNLPYSDTPADRATQIAISTLTEFDIVDGNPDGTFKPNVPVNRAEFMKIAMKLLPSSHVRINTRCFPDVDPDIWFAEPVCRAKALGIISGNASPDVDPSLWPFEPARSVKYEEALKVLSGIYDIPLLQINGDWFETYVRSAEKSGVHLLDSAAGSALTRGQMARLVTAYWAYARGELEELRYAESHSSMSARTIFSAPSSELSSVSSASSESSASSASSAVYDDLLYDTSTDDAVLVLGKVTHILGSAELFANAEPIEVQEFEIRLVAANDSLSAINVYDHDGKYIGRATADTGTTYILRVKNQNIVLPYRDEYSFYVRGVLSNQDAGGTSGGSIEIDEMGVRGIGAWSHRSYSQFTVGEVFASTTVARSAITTIRNAGDERSILVSGQDLEIGSFFFEGVTGHSAARLQITDINFTVGMVGTVNLSNITIKADGGSERSSCSLAGTTLTCGSLPASFGRLDDGSRVLRIYADIDTDNQGSKGLQLTINDPGSIGSPGDITWTDGVTVFTWIDFGNKPIARGTYYSY